MDWVEKWGSREVDKTAKNISKGVNSLKNKAGDIFAGFGKSLGSVFAWGIKLKLLLLWKLQKIQEYTLISWKTLHIFNILEVLHLIKRLSILGV